MSTRRPAPTSWRANVQPTGPEPTMNTSVRAVSKLTVTVLSRRGTRSSVASGRSGRGARRAEHVAMQLDAGLVDLVVADRVVRGGDEVQPAVAGEVRHGDARGGAVGHQFADQHLARGV